MTYLARPGLSKHITQLETKYMTSMTYLARPGLS